ncbi:MAG: gamma-glutamylcyclotransferase family protein [Chloroflexota bacterium]
MYYFAYGSNLNKSLLAERCPGFKPVCSAVLPNYKLIFTGWSRKWRGGVASIKSYQGEKVPGAIYEGEEKDFQRLDRYEDVPANYCRLNVLVLDEDGKAYQGVTYIKSGQIDETPPSKEYLLTIRQGYKDWGIV